MQPDITMFRNPRVILVPGSDGYVAYNVDTRQLHRLNPSAALVLELFNGTRTIQDVCEELQPILGIVEFDSARNWIDHAVRVGFLSSASLRNTPVPSLTASEATERARELRNEGEILAAYACQCHASSLAPADASSLRELGELAHILGRRDAARSAYEAYLSIRPDDAEISHVLISLRDGTPPGRAPDECIRQLYSRFADFYEDNMCDELHYQAPALLAAAVEETIGRPDSGDLLESHGSMAVLDLGCGTGLMGEHLRPLAHKLTGIDLSPEMIGRARKFHSYDQLEVDEITEWLGRGSQPEFDLIVACDTLIYFGDLSQVIGPAAKRLAPGGTLAFTVEKGAHDTPFGLTDSGRYTHTTGHIESVARGAGLKINRISTEVLRYEYGEPVEGLLTVLSN
jgi:predicted TPR repeat methyltransferase